MEGTESGFKGGYVCQRLSAVGPTRPSEEEESSRKEKGDGRKGPRVKQLPILVPGDVPP